VKKGRIFVYGAGGHGKVVADILVSKGESEFAGFVDDREELWGAKVIGFPVLGGGQWLRQEALTSPIAVALGVGANQSRQLLAERCARWGIEILTLLHPAATVSQTAQLGRGTVVMAGAIINPDARVGVGVIVNSGAVIEHDVEIGDYAHVAPNAVMGGASHLGSFSHLGLGAVVLQCIHIGSHTIVGAGAVVVKNLPDQVVAIGVPARIHRQLGQEGLSEITAASRG
jgi:sugar O-acyltransferase (sialic acid O-acetyltransferase NeuD family)